MALFLFHFVIVYLDARIKFWFHRTTLIQQQYLCQWLTAWTHFLLVYFQSMVIQSVFFLQLEERQRSEEKQRRAAGIKWKTKVRQHYGPKTLRFHGCELEKGKTELAYVDVFSNSSFVDNFHSFLSSYFTK